MDNELVTKDFLKETLDGVLNEALDKHRSEFQRVISEEFQPKLNLIMETVGRNGFDMNKLETKMENIENEVSVISSDVRTIKRDMKKGFHEVLGAIEMIGNKVYGDHEDRIVALEN